MLFRGDQALKLAATPQPKYKQIRATKDSERLSVARRTAYRGACNQSPLIRIHNNNRKPMRWHTDKPLMERRYKTELRKHRKWDLESGPAQQDCHCLKGIGTMRKHKPNERCSNHTYCPLCKYRRIEKRVVRRKFRRLFKRITDPVEVPKLKLYW